MFFCLTNLPATFQMMINKILWNLINTREVASFIEDVIVEMKKEKKHDKVVKEIVNRLAEKYLYVKPEKCK